MLEEKRQILEFGEFRLDTAKRQLLRDGEVVPLYSKAFDLLLLLVQSNGQDLAKDEILERIWPGQILEESNLTVNISAVRRALGEKAARPRYLVTIPGRGYRFVAPVRSAEIELTEVLLESEITSEITIEEEADDDEVAAIPPAAAGNHKQLSSSITGATADIAVPVRSARFTPRRIVVAIVGISILAIASFLLIRWLLPKAVANRFAEIKLRQLTNDGRVINAAISPDGRLYVFAHQVKDVTSLELGSIDGEAPIELLAPAPVAFRAMTFSADGSSLFYVTVDNANKAALYRLPLLGRVPVKLRDNFSTYFALSPDNQSVVTVKSDEATHTDSLLVSNLDGSNERELIRLPFNRGLFARNLSWSPDGQRIALGAELDETGSRGAVFTISANGGELKQLTEAHWREIERTAWLGDGSAIFMIGAAHDTEERRQLWLVDFPSGSFRRITNDLDSYDIGLSTAATANRVLLVQHQQISNIWVAPAEDISKARQITFGAFNRGDGGLGLDFGTNGRIIYTSTVGGTPTIWAMDADGANARELTPPGAADSTPSVTADGGLIVFESMRGGATDIWRMNADGSAPKQLTKCGKNMQPSVSPDANWVVYRSECDGVGSLWRVPIDGGDPVRLNDKAVTWPWVSPDSKLVACEYASGSEKTQLAIIPLNGGPPQKLFDVPSTANFRYGIRWTPDGKAVTYRDRLLGIWRQPMAGGAAERIAGLPPEKIFPYSWSRDGKFLAFTRGVEIRDVVLISDAKQD